MRRLSCLLSCLMFPSLAIGQPDLIKVQASYIKVPVTALDEKGRTLQNLHSGDFELLDEGIRRPIENFLIDHAPIHVLLLLDVSGSMKEEIKEVKIAALRFAGSFTRDDRISIMSFSDELLLLQDWTNSIKPIRKALRKLKPGYRTALYDAVAQGVREHFAPIQGRRVIIVLTDGLDNESTTTHEKLISSLIRSDVTLYVVSRTRLVRPKVSHTTRVEFLNEVMKKLLRDDGDFVETYFKEKETAIQQLAEATGGRALFPEHLEELGEAYADVARELKQQYVLTFRPPQSSDKVFRKIELICSVPLGRLHYRRQYVWLSELTRPAT